MSPQGPAPYLGDQSRSPIVAASISSIVCAFLSVGFMASYLPQKAPLGWSIAFLIASVVLLLAALGLLSRLQDFAWKLYFDVFRWVSVLPVLFAVTAIFVFVADGTKGTTLAIMIAVLVLAAVNIPLVVAYSVARHQPLTAPQSL